MRIAHFLAEPFNSGGIATYIKMISDELRKRGHSMFIFDFGGSADREQEDVTVVAIGKQRSLESAVSAFGIDVLHIHGLMPIPHGLACAVLRTVHEHQPYCPSATKFLKRRNLPCGRPFGLVGCAYGHIVEHCGSVRPRSFIADFRRTYQERDLASRTTTIAISQFVREAMRRSAYDMRRVHVLHNPAPDVDEVPPLLPSGELRLLYMGRLVPVKGVEWLLHTMATLDDRIALDIAGDGYQADKLKRLASRLGLDHRVEFHGWVGGNRLEELIAACRAVVVPSVWHEAFGLATVEGMARGRCVIASNTGATPEIIKHMETGVLVNPGNVGDLAAAIRLIAADHALANSLGAAAAIDARQRFSLKRYIGRLEELYALALSERAA